VGLRPQARSQHLHSATSRSSNTGFVSVSELLCGAAMLRLFTERNKALFFSLEALNHNKTVFSPNLTFKWLNLDLLCRVAMVAMAFWPGQGDSASHGGKPSC